MDPKTIQVTSTCNATDTGQDALISQDVNLMKLDTRSASQGPVSDRLNMVHHDKEISLQTVATQPQPNLIDCENVALQDISTSRQECSQNLEHLQHQTEPVKAPDAQKIVNPSDGSQPIPEDGNNDVQSTSQSASAYKLKRLAVGNVSKKQTKCDDINTSRTYANSSSAKRNLPMSLLSVQSEQDMDFTHYYLNNSKVLTLNIGTDKSIVDFMLQNALDPKVVDQINNVFGYNPIILNAGLNSCLQIQKLPIQSNIQQSRKIRVCMTTSIEECVPKLLSNGYISDELLSLLIHISISPEYGILYPSFIQSPEIHYDDDNNIGKLCSGKKVCFCPFIFSQHWFLMIICNQESFILDGMNHVLSQDLQQQQEFIDMLTTARSITSCESTQVLPITMKCEIGKHPQLTGFDCGLFIIFVMLKIMKHDMPINEIQNIEFLCDSASAIRQRAFTLISTFSRADDQQDITEIDNKQQFSSDYEVVSTPMVQKVPIKPLKKTKPSTAQVQATTKQHDNSQYPPKANIKAQPAKLESDAFLSIFGNFTDHFCFNVSNANCYISFERMQYNWHQTFLMP
ncbi:C-terminal catalytic domain [Hexamita inflata]|uniref:C-terminal catalytic domain n=1 Tax=Hexamita inflata TaxID=28002 RepID=A0AA86R5L3_9EUKA|nr:C-terminal catalytic domain [Hexamita inflata]